MPVAPRPALPTGGVVRVPAGTAAPVNSDPYRRVTRNGVSVLVRWSQLTAAERTHYGNNPNPAQPGGAAPSGPPPQPSSPPQPGYEWQLVEGQWRQVLTQTDPRDSQYQTEVGQAAFDRDRATFEQEYQRAQLPSLYNRGAADIRTSYDRNRYDSNAELARRGIIRSGEYQRRGADRLIEQTRQTADLDRQYGSGAQSQIAQRLADINAQYQLSQAYIYSSIGGG